MDNFDLGIRSVLIASNLHVITNNEAELHQFVWVFRPSGGKIRGSPGSVPSSSMSSKFLPNCGLQELCNLGILFYFVVCINLP
jgi:hypothetical protein